MSDIKITDIKDLRPAGSEFFTDDESFITELSDHDMSVWGGAKTLSATGNTKITAQSHSSVSLSKG